MPTFGADLVIVFGLAFVLLVAGNSFWRLDGGNCGAVFSSSSNSERFRLLGRARLGVEGGDDASAESGDEGPANDATGFRRPREPYVRCTLEVHMVWEGRKQRANSTDSYWQLMPRRHRVTPNQRVASICLC